jgi:prepilin-type N-terminal cleavage/methylation domain-containing protein
MIFPAARASRQSGFTLIELSIVLVIIGLIVGGVLVGQDLIKAAEVRATVAQIEKYNSAINTFRGKYAYIPGDITGAQATVFGLEARAGTVGLGDGNGLLQGVDDDDTVGNGLYCGQEQRLFWDDLSTTNLVDGNYNANANLTTALSTAEALQGIFPGAKLGRGNMITVFSASGYNYYEITGITACADNADPGFAYTLTTSLTPQEAFNIDSKMDDSRPATGTVRGMLATGAVDTACDVVAGDACCTTASRYQTTTQDLANTPACQLRLRFN